MTALSLNKYGKTYEVKNTNGKFFYWSPLAMRWLPVKKAEVTDITSEIAQAASATKH